MIAKAQLAVAAALFLGWLGWLGYAVSQKGTVQIVSSGQLAGATHWVIAEITVGPDGVPLPKVTAKQTLKGDTVGSIEVRNLPSAATPLPVGESRTPAAGEYLLPLVKLNDGVYAIAGLPHSPGYEPQSFDRPVIYPWTDDVKKQLGK